MTILLLVFVASMVTIALAFLVARAIRVSHNPNPLGTRLPAVSEGALSGGSTSAEGEGAHPGGEIRGEPPLAASHPPQGVPRPDTDDGTTDQVTRYAAALSLIAIQGCVGSPSCRLVDERQSKWCDACIALDALQIETTTWDKNNRTACEEDPR